MYRNFLFITFRKLFRNKSASLIKMISLCAGIVCFILIAVFVRNEFSYDQFHKNAGRIVRLTMEYSVDGKANKWSVTGTKPGPQFQRSFPAVNSYCRMIMFSRVLGYKDNLFDEKNVLYADSSFLDIFSFPLLTGNRETALDAPGNIVLTKSMAEKYFGDEDPLGKIMVISGDQNFMVSGILADIPENSQIQFDFLIPFSSMEVSKTEEWWTANYITYLLLEEKADRTSTEKQINDYMRSLSKTELELTGNDYQIYHLEPFIWVHLHSKLGGLQPNGNITYIYILMIIAVLILIIASINYSNLTIALFSERKTEIGIRKVLGAQKWQLFRLFLGESAMLTLFAALFAWVISSMILPFFNQMTGKEFDMVSLLQPWIILLLLLLCFIISFIAGAYPAIILSDFKLVNILKSGFHISGTGRNLRKSQIVFQFIISIFLIIITLVIQQQRKFIQNKSLGYDKEHVIFLPLDQQVRPQYDALKAAIKQDPRVQNVSAGYETPTVIHWTNSLTYAGETGEKQISTRAIPVDLDFLNTLGIRIIAGSDFTEADQQDLIANRNSDKFRLRCILNETAVKSIGWTPEEAIGREIAIGRPGIVKAVVQDFHMASLHEPLMPLVIFLDNYFLRKMFVKLKGSDIPVALSSIETLWKERIPGRPYEYQFLDEEYDAMYKAEQKTAGIFGAFSTLAILLACLGLFGLAAISTIQRTKEIGIRKVLGATVGNITVLLSEDFIRLVLIAFLIAAPVSWYAAHIWLENFAFHISVPLWVFGVSGFLAIMITLLTVSYQSIKAALSNPVDSLRNE